MVLYYINHISIIFFIGGIKHPCLRLWDIGISKLWNFLKNSLIITQKLDMIIALTKMRMVWQLSKKIKIAFSFIFLCLFSSRFVLYKWIWSFWNIVTKTIKKQNLEICEIFCLVKLFNVLYFPVYHWLSSKRQIL